MTAARVLVVGAGGLLGGAVVRELGRRRVPVARARVPWDDADAAVAAVVSAAADVHQETGGDWSLAWCAGAGVVGADQAQLDAEVATIARVVDRLSAPDGPRPRSAFFASSAGAVYAGSDAPPFTERSEPRPLGGYGHAKLRAEAEIARLCPQVRVVVGRISNLYGPGQDLSKNQGLVSRLCLSHLLREPVGVYVSLDTLRDYVYVDDCAALVVDALDRVDRLAPDEAPSPVVKIIASQQAASIAHLLGECRRVFGHRVLVRMASSNLSAQQTRDLRLRSVVWPELDRRSMTTLVHGIHATTESLRGQLGSFTGRAAAR
ncbi:NAD-dependent epimerase/dehydratase family protein [Cellulomonas fimi]|uniref:NAD-dependent epimerase/dehydratase family protein n=1 Tax=Cellulomonas fimi TaxID=1708 RepID=UPI00234C3728|nr:NAD-dependent epimerase/dehydratase family protein [Cellulomonas fimi]MDC7123248.1 NAD-dependent epimerase/dehydratase family protein [Cellulomonas fimi]